MTLNNDVRALTANMSHYLWSILTTELELMTCNEPCLVTSTLSAQLGWRLIGIGRHFYTTEHRAPSSLTNLPYCTTHQYSYDDLMASRKSSSPKGFSSQIAIKGHAEFRFQEGDLTYN